MYETTMLQMADRNECSENEKDYRMKNATQYITKITL
jgi:hypothetical protein